MERVRPAVLEKLALAFDDALRSAVSGGPEQVLESAERLSAGVPALKAWRDQLGAGAGPDDSTVLALQQIQERAFRLARVVRHAQWVRQGLTDIASGVPNAYGRDGRSRSVEETRLAVEG